MYKGKLDEKDFDFLRGFRMGGLGRRSLSAASAVGYLLPLTFKMVIIQTSSNVFKSIPRTCGNFVQSWRGINLRSQRIDAGKMT